MTGKQEPKESKVTPISALLEDDESIVPDEYRTEKGVVLKLQPVSQVLIEGARQRVRQEFIDRGEPVDPPVFRFKDVGGTVEEQPLMVDEETGKNNLDNPNDPEETRRNWALWNAHKDALVRLEDAQNNEATKVTIMLGCEVGLPEDTDWMDSLEMILGKNIREMPRLEQRFYYVWYWLLTTYDQAQIVPLLQVHSFGKIVKPEQMRFFREEFQRAFERRAEETIGPAIEQITAALSGTTDDGAAVAGRDSVSGAQGGEGAQQDD